MTKKTHTYKDAGVDIDAGDRFIDEIKRVARRTYIPGVRSDIGGFAAFFQPDLAAYRKPILVSSTDGVGTKLKIAFGCNRFDTVGIDLVAMCVNDVVVTGATPLFFLDYLATGRLNERTSVDIIRGISKGCMMAGCALIGGETAEMPGFYAGGEFDLAGFAVGIVDEDAIIDGATIQPGDIIIGLASHGLHSNGFSLVRRIFLEEMKLSLTDHPSELDSPLGEELLRPTRIYVKTILSLIKQFPVRGIAHITGGGISGNVPRVLPKGCKAVIQTDSWAIPPIFSLLRKSGVPDTEMWRTFNNGIGMVVVVRSQDADEVVAAARKMGERASVIGKIAPGQGVTFV